MALKQAIPPPSPTPVPRLEQITPQQVWSTLSPSQHRNVLQTVVTVCQDLLVAMSPIQLKEGIDE